MAQPAQPFALAPAFAIPDVFDFTNPAHSKLFNKGSSALNITHDGTTETLRPFLDAIKRRSLEYDCDNLLTVQDAAGINTFSIIDESRLVPMEDIENAAGTYMNTQTRIAQDNYMLQKCIMESLSQEALIKLQLSPHAHEINGEVCAAMLIKKLILMCEVENYATSFHVRDQMTKLKQKMIEVDYDIDDFNEHVIKLRRQLQLGGEESNDLFMHVMKAYLICKDKDFVAEIKDLQRKYIRGDLPRELPDLMLAAQNEFQRLMQDKTYNKPSQEEAQLIALTAKLEQETEARAKLEKKYQSFKSRQDKGKDTSAEDKDKREKQKKKDEAWMFVPDPNGKLTMMRSGAEWIWCTEHQKWGKHELKDCRKHIKKKQSSKSTSEDQGETSMSAAIAAVLEEEDDDQQE